MEDDNPCIHSEHLYPFATIHTPTGSLTVYWCVTDRNVYINTIHNYTEYKNPPDAITHEGAWYIYPGIDTMEDSIADILACDTTTLQWNHLDVRYVDDTWILSSYERQRFYTFRWSDYMEQYITLRCSVRSK